MQDALRAPGMSQNMTNPTMFLLHSIHYVCPCLYLVPSTLPHYDFIYPADLSYSSSCPHFKSFLTLSVSIRVSSAPPSPYYQLMDAKYAPAGC